VGDVFRGVAVPGFVDLSGTMLLWRRDFPAGLSGDVGAEPGHADLFRSVAPAGVQIGDREFQGADQLRAMLNSRDATSPRHHYGNLVSTARSADTVQAHAYFTLLARNGQIVGLGTYDDELVHIPASGWRWTRKRVNFEWRA